MVSPLTQSQITLPLLLARLQAREEMVWVSLISRLLETRLLQVGLCCRGSGVGSRGLAGSCMRAGGVCFSCVLVQGYHWIANSHMSTGWEWGR
jgi:hypothetical protein